MSSYLVQVVPAVAIAVSMDDLTQNIKLLVEGKMDGLDQMSTSFAAQVRDVREVAKVAAGEVTQRGFGLQAARSWFEGSS